MKNTFSFSLKVSTLNIDDLNHVNNLVYLNWVLKAAEKHWKSLSTDFLMENYSWVVLRHEIDYLKSAMLHDEITVVTWIGESYGVKSERFVEIKIENKLIAKAKTIWCLLDKKTMRPVRIPNEIIKIFNN